jgi:hypothetical protein
MRSPNGLPPTTLSNGVQITPPPSAAGYPPQQGAHPSAPQPAFQTQPPEKKESLGRDIAIASGAVLLTTGAIFAGTKGNL